MLGGDGDDGTVWLQELIDYNREAIHCLLVDVHVFAYNPSVSHQQVHAFLVLRRFAQQGK